MCIHIYAYVCAQNRRGVRRPALWKPRPGACRSASESPTENPQPTIRNAKRYEKKDSELGEVKKEKKEKKDKSKDKAEKSGKKRKGNHSHADGNAPAHKKSKKPKSK